MGDMGETFRAMTKHDKERRQRNLEQNKQSKLPWKEFTPWHWRVTLQGDALDFWPTKNKWRWRGDIYHGDVEGFINKRLEEPDDTGQLELELQPQGES
jgi:hypothetical protein